MGLLVIEMVASWGSYCCSCVTFYLSFCRLLSVPQCSWQVNSFNRVFDRWYVFNLAVATPLHPKPLPVAVLDAGRNSMSFFMLLVVSLGLSVVTESLGRTMFRCKLLAGAHFVFGSKFSQYGVGKTYNYLQFCMPLALLNWKYSRRQV